MATESTAHAATAERQGVAIMSNAPYDTPILLGNAAQARGFSILPATHSTPDRQSFVQSNQTHNPATLTRRMRARQHKPLSPSATQRISVSMARADLDVLKRRARKLYGGSLSAAVREGVRHIREQEGREALVMWLGAAAEATESQRQELRSEWQTKDVQQPSRTRKR
jgi:hypothetical protein